MSISRLQLRTNIHLCLKDVIDYASSTQDLKMVCFDNFWEGDGHKIGKEKSHETAHGHPHLVGVSNSGGTNLFGVLL